MLKTPEHSPHFKALSPLDNCPKKAGRASTDKTIAVNYNMSSAAG